MNSYIVVYYDNKFKQMKNIICNCIFTKKEVVDEFNKIVPKDCSLVNIIEL